VGLFHRFRADGRQPRSHTSGLVPRNAVVLTHFEWVTFHLDEKSASRTSTFPFSVGDSRPVLPMSDMYSLTDETRIDIEVVVTEVPGVAAGMMESTEEIEVGKFMATLPSELATGGDRAGDRRGRTLSVSAGRISDWCLWCGADRERIFSSAGLG
jgi:hypothetical protein